MKNSFVILFTLLFFIARSQNSKLISSTVFSTVANADEDYWIQGDPNAGYLINSSESLTTGQCLLYKFDTKTGFKIFEKELHFSESGILKLITAIYLNETINLFIVVTNVEEKKVYLIQKKINAITGIEIENSKEIDRFEIEFETDILRDFIVIFSPDNSKMGILREEISSSRERITHAKVLDVKEQKVIWKQKLNTNSENEIPSGKNFIVDNHANIFYLFETIDYHFHGIQKLFENLTQNKTLLLPTGNNSLNNPVIELVNNTLLCSGEFLEGERSNKTLEQDVRMGFFLMNIDAEKLQIINQTFDYLSEEFQQKLTYRDKNYFFKLEGIKSNHYSHKIYQHFKTIEKNGSFYVIKYNGYSYETEKINGEEIHHEYHREILVFKYSNYLLNWSRIIPRNIHNQNKLGLEISIDHQLNLFYFDNAENLKKFPETENYNKKDYSKVKGKSALVSAFINENGNIQRNIISSEKRLFINVYDKRNPFYGISAPFLTEFKRKTRKVHFLQIN